MFIIIEDYEGSVGKEGERTANKKEFKEIRKKWGKAEENKSVKE